MRFTILALISLLSVFLTIQAEGIQLELKEKDLRDAIEYGRARRELSHPELMKDWRIDLGYGVGSATIITPFAGIVILAKEAALKLMEPSEYEIRKSMEEKKDQLSFGCAIYGETIDFAGKYKAVLEYKGQKLEPSNQDVPSTADYTRTYPKSPRYWALCFYRFSVGSVDPQVAVTLILKGPEGKELKFPFDLSKVR